MKSLRLCKTFSVSSLRTLKSRGIALAALVALHSIGLPLGGFLTTARADVFTISSQETGGNVVIMYSGSFDTSAFPMAGPGANSANGIAPNSGQVFQGSGVMDFYEGVLPGVLPPFGTGGIVYATTGSGDAFAFLPDIGGPGFIFQGGLNLPVGYMSGSLLAGSLTFNGHSFMSLGITPMNFSYLTTDGNNTIFFDFPGIVIPPPGPGMPPVPQASGSGGNSPSFVVIDNGSIVSTLTTGLSSINAALSQTQNAAQTATQNLNNRIFRARAGSSNPNSGGTGVTTTDGTSRYLNFAANNGIDYRVALGLAEGESLVLSDAMVSGHPFALAGGASLVTGQTIVVPAMDDGKGVVHESKAVIPVESPTRWVAFTEFDYGNFDQDWMSRSARGLD